MRPPRPQTSYLRTLVYLWAPLIAIIAAFAGLYLHERNKVNSKPRLITAPAVIESIWREPENINGASGDDVRIVSKGRSIVLYFDLDTVGGLRRDDRVTFARTAGGRPMWLKTRAGKEYDTANSPKSEASLFLFMTAFMTVIGGSVLTLITVAMYKASHRSRLIGGEMLARTQGADAAPDAAAPATPTALSYRRFGSQALPPSEEET